MQHCSFYSPCKIFQDYEFRLYVINKAIPLPMYFQEGAAYHTDMPTEHLLLFLQSSFKIDKRSSGIVHASYIFVFEERREEVEFVLLWLSYSSKSVSCNKINPHQCSPQLKMVAGFHFHPEFQAFCDSGLNEAGHLMLHIIKAKLCRFSKIYVQSVKVDEVI